jgi:hypothetical protein
MNDYKAFISCQSLYPEKKPVCEWRLLKYWSTVGPENIRRFLEDQAPLPSAICLSFSVLPLPEIIDPVFVKTRPKRSFSMTEYERFWLVLTNTRVYKFGHLCRWSSLLTGGWEEAKSYDGRKPGPLEIVQCSLVLQYSTLVNVIHRQVFSG